MGVDVGVVNITYLERPEEPAYDFLYAIAEGSMDEDWGGGWNGNAFVEFMKESLLERANNWANDEGLNPQERSTLIQWVEELPWRGNTIMLHLNW